LWFSLQLTSKNAKDLYDWDLKGNFGELIEAGAQMTRTGRTALKFALDVRKSGTIGTDILVPEKGFAALEALWKARFVEIADAGLAVKGDIVDPGPRMNVIPRSSPDEILEGGPVIVAIIDDGIGIANHRFRQGPTETRVKHFLDLALIGTPTASGWVDDVLGRSWKGQDIDLLLDKHEEQVYRALGLINHTCELRQPHRAAVTHGTHMLDLAAGYDWQIEGEKAKHRPIIAVQLPAQVAENRSDTWLPQSLKRALDWILVKADELSDELSVPRSSDGKSRRLPLIVNGSFASMAGPQDGYSDVEERITQFLETYRGNGPKDLCTFVLSAGNSFQLRTAAEMDIPARGSGEISWRVLPDDKTPSFVQIWLPEGVGIQAKDKKPQQVKVSLVPPRDAPDSPLPSQLDAAVEWKKGEHIVARIYHQRVSRPRGSRECITIAIRPTAEDRAGEPVVPSGQWRIRIENTINKELGIDLRVHRDDVGMFARTGARQSYFDDPHYERFDPDSGAPINDERRGGDPNTQVTRQGTLSTYAYAEGVIAVSGYRNSDGEPALYSSSGSDGVFTAASPSLSGMQARSGHPKRRGKAVEGLGSIKPPDSVYGPDWAAVSEESPALSGVLAAGTYSGSVAILGGTSVAAPQVTRALADKIAGGGSVESLNSDVAASDNSIEQKAAAAFEKSKLAPLKQRPLRYGAGRMAFKSSYPKRR